MDAFDFPADFDLTLRSSASRSPGDPFRCWEPTALESWDALFDSSRPLIFFDQPPSPTDTCASASSSASSPGMLSPGGPAHVICNAPLVAPVPLPYHSPTFLQFESLPDIDEDLSHPPYTCRPNVLKRKWEPEPELSARERRQKPRQSMSGRPVSSALVHPARARLTRGR
ncbi:unnamed protein product [Mycena citricolor]|uniref:Uncharacterized protein n=1 Tax=Mycena citricolor TaxID=2018698 RepID=A0AAD2GVG9_9AGAR|nr:unnamed protein product [Mycena citricolor]CAK5278149.1 unnamed protein product [Mycena citricolor]